jgi:hypothetical protein|tara:strand:- start:1145 stop:2065 length:921 start_codon:yes stop_codon:yes gene_type:complete
MKIKIRSRSFTLPDLPVPKIKMSMDIPKLPIDMPMPKFPNLKISGKKLVGMSILVSVAVMGIAIATAIVSTREAPPEFPAYGQYQLNASDDEMRLGKKLTFADDMPSEERATQTLLLGINGARIDKINITGIDVGKTSTLSETVKIAGGTVGGIEVTTLTLDNISAPSFKISNSECYKLTITDNKADGLSLSPTIATTTDIEVGSKRGAVDVPNISSGSFDRIIIDSSTATSQIDTITLKDVSAYGTIDGQASIWLDYIFAGECIIKNSSVGTGDGIDIADFTVVNTTKTSSATISGNTEIQLAIK